MAEYIEREAVLETLEQCRKEYNAVMNVDGACAMVIAKSVVKKQPTADVVEVVHGEWDKRFILFHCSECKNTAEWDYPYCPHCGAKMDGKGDE